MLRSLRQGPTASCLCLGRAAAWQNGGSRPGSVSGGRHTGAKWPHDEEKQIHENLTPLSRAAHIDWVDWRGVREREGRTSLRTSSRRRGPNAGLVFFWDAKPAQSDPVPRRGPRRPVLVTRRDAGGTDRRPRLTSELHRVVGCFRTQAATVSKPARSLPLLPAVTERYVREHAHERPARGLIRIRKARALSPTTRPEQGLCFRIVPLLS